MKVSTRYFKKGRASICHHPRDLREKSSSQEQQRKRVSEVASNDVHLRIGELPFHFAQELAQPSVVSLQSVHLLFCLRSLHLGLDGDGGGRGSLVVVVGVEGG